MESVPLFLVYVFWFYIKIIYYFIKIDPFWTLHSYIHLVFQ